MTFASSDFRVTTQSLVPIGKSKTNQRGVGEVDITCRLNSLHVWGPGIRQIPTRLQKCRLRPCVTTETRPNLTGRRF